MSHRPAPDAKHSNGEPDSQDYVPSGNDDDNVRQAPPATRSCAVLAQTQLSDLVLSCSLFTVSNNRTSDGGHLSNSSCITNEAAILQASEMSQDTRVSLSSGGSLSGSLPSSQSGTLRPFEQDRSLTRSHGIGTATSSHSVPLDQSLEQNQDCGQPASSAAIANDSMLGSPSGKDFDSAMGVDPVFDNFPPDAQWIQALYEAFMKKDVVPECQGV